MEEFFGFLNRYIPYVIVLFGIYFTLVIGSCFIGTIKQKKQDNSLVSCMSKTGNIVYGVTSAIYLILWASSIYYFMYLLNHNVEFNQALNAFNGLTIYTMIFAMFIQDYIHVGRKKLIMGNRLFEYRRMKKVVYGKKHKATFIYGQKQYTFSTRFVDVTKLKQYLAKVK